MTLALLTGATLTAPGTVSAISIEEGALKTTRQCKLWRSSLLLRDFQEPHISISQSNLEAAVPSPSGVQLHLLGIVIYGATPLLVKLLTSPPNT